MIKKFLLPFQVVLLKRRLCPGCTHSLDNIGKREAFRTNKVMVTCKCNRRYVLDQDSNQYRRASASEEKEFLNKRGVLK